jgi:hypothetical protein
MELPTEISLRFAISTVALPKEGDERPMVFSPAVVPQANWT